ncbi:MAG: hypothetical protein RQ982_06370 [Gammaproteobacteria bacterium]|nr:hypothetical protein [Gammaproteobacteria bacterium]
MSIKKEFEELIETLKIQRDKAKVKIHLASMDARDEFDEAEKKWKDVKAKALEIADDTKEFSEDFIAKAKVVGEELKETYHRIDKRLSK